MDKNANLIQCDKCNAQNLPAYADRHAAIHARELREHNRRVEMDAAITALVGPTRKA